MLLKKLNKIQNAFLIKLRQRANIFKHFLKLKLDLCKYIYLFSSVYWFKRQKKNDQQP